MSTTLENYDPVYIKSIKPKKKFHLKKSLRYINQHKYLYLLAMPVVVYLFIFKYIPIYGITLAFKEYMYNMGILNSPWVGFEHFRILFSRPDFYRVLWNTISISLLRIAIEFPAPIILALLLNEMRGTYLKRFFQTIYTFPNFLSWVIVAGMTFVIFGNGGLVNNVIHTLGGEKIDILTNQNNFLILLFASNIWKSSGWAAIIYLSTISSIDTAIYEAAIVDGANRFQRAIHVTVAGMAPTIIILLVLSFGGVMNAGFDQIFNLYNPLVADRIEIIDTYIYKITFMEGGNFSFSTAVGFFKSVTNLLLLAIANKITKLSGQRGIF